MGKILFTDLDGTLLNDRKEITPGNRAAMDRALARGGRIVLTTGRPLASGIKQSKRLGLDGPGCYLIAFNGGVIYDCGERRILYAKTLPIALALELIRLCDPLELHVQTYNGDFVLVEPKNDDEALRSYCQRLQIDRRVVSSFVAELREEPPKVLAIAPRERLERLYKVLEKEYAHRVDFFYSSETLLEIVPTGVSKGSAVKWTCEMLGMPLFDAIAVGDEENDLSMIQAAGIGVAMANGIEKLKQAADYVTLRDNNHDGIAEILEKFM